METSVCSEVGRDINIYGDARHGYRAIVQHRCQGGFKCSVLREMMAYRMTLTATTRDVSANCMDTATHSPTGININLSQKAIVSALDLAYREHRPTSWDNKTGKIEIL